MTTDVPEPQSITVSPEKRGLEAYFVDRIIINIPVLIIPLIAPFILYVYIHFIGASGLELSIKYFRYQIDLEKILQLESTTTSMTSALVGNVGSRLNSYVTWQCASFIFIFICLMAVVLSVFIIKSYAKRVFCVYIIVMIIVIVIWYVIWLTLDAKLGSMVRSIVMDVLLTASIINVVTPEINHIKIVTYISHVSGTSAFIGLSFASLCIVSRSIRERESEEKESARKYQFVWFLAEQLSQMKIILYTGSACLFSGIFALQAFFLWRADILPEPLRTDALELGNVVLLLWTVQWSIALSGIYLVPVGVLYRRVDKIFREKFLSEKEVKRQEWMESHGLNVSVGQVAIKAAALLGPVLAGSQLLPTLITLL